MHNFQFGDIIIAQIQFIDSLELKSRPALVLFEEGGNIVIAGISSNLERTGVKLLKKEGAVKDSIIRLNYIFTISNQMIKKPLFTISNEKKKIIINEIIKRLIV
ncbi:MAG: type II toxin-antitoxin system PemK/MazF family toxin [Nanoarchaeota archaeon]